MEELVVLVDKYNTPIGTAPKATVHTKNTPLHRGFSLFVFHSDGRFLVTQRALDKATFPGVWTNTVCGHPAPQEAPMTAAIRRVDQELGLQLTFIEQVANYQYVATDKNGIMENEICPVFVGISDDEPHPMLHEVETLHYMSWQQFRTESKEREVEYSHWCKEEQVYVDRYIHYAQSFLFSSHV